MLAPRSKLRQRACRRSSVAPKLRISELRKITPADAKSTNFKTTIAFIPYNFRRSSKRIVRLFQQNANRISLCFHATTTPVRSLPLRSRTVECDALDCAEAHGRPWQINRPALRPVMVFPQGRFSVDAMATLGSHNFDAAVNTVPRPYGQSDRLTLRELSEPAVLRYSGFPLFLRKSSMDTKDSDIAFKLFFGIPILIVEHHNIFADPQRLIEAVHRINRAAPGIHWSSAGDAVRGSILQKRVSPDLVHVKAYARSIRVENSRFAPQMFRIEWGWPASKSSLRWSVRQQSSMRRILRRRIRHHH